MKVACCSRTPFERLLDFFVGDRDLRLVCPQLFVSVDLDLGHDFEAGFEAQGFVVLQMEIGDLGLRYRDQALLVGFFAEIARDQRVQNFGLDLFGETLADNRRRYMPTPEPRKAREFLIFLDECFSFRLTSCTGISTSNLPLGTTIVSVGLTFAFQALTVRTVPFWNWIGVERHWL